MTSKNLPMAHWSVRLLSCLAVLIVLSSALPRTEQAFAQQQQPRSVRTSQELPDMTIRSEQADIENVVTCIPQGAQRIPFMSDEIGETAPEFKLAAPESTRQAIELGQTMTQQLRDAEDHLTKRIAYLESLPNVNNGSLRLSWMVTDVAKQRRALTSLVERALLEEQSPWKQRGPIPAATKLWRRCHDVERLLKELEVELEPLTDNG